MNTNSFFSPLRFYRFLKSDLLLNQKRYLFAILGAAVGIYLLLLFFMYNNRWHFFFDNYLPVLVMCAFGLGAFIGNAFPDLNDRVKTANYLLYPASTFEKVLSQFLIYIVFGSVFLLCIFWIDAQLARWTMFLRESVRTAESIIDPFHFSALTKMLPERNLYRIITLFVIFDIGAILFTLRLFFRRFALVKSLIFIIVLTLLFAGFMQFFMDDISRFFHPREVIVVGNLKNYELFLYAMASSWLFLLPLAYYKFKEKQV